MPWPDRSSWSWNGCISVVGVFENGFSYPASPSSCCGPYIGYGPETSLRTVPKHKHQSPDGWSPSPTKPEAGTVFKGNTDWSFTDGALLGILSLLIGLYVCLTYLKEELWYLHTPNIRLHRESTYQQPVQISQYRGIFTIHFFKKRVLEPP